MGADAGALLIQRIVQIQQLCSRIRKGFILMQRMQQAIAFIDGRNTSSSKRATACDAEELSFSYAIIRFCSCSSASAVLLPAAVPRRFHSAERLEIPDRPHCNHCGALPPGHLHGTVAVIALLRLCQQIFIACKSVQQKLVRCRITQILCVMLGMNIDQLGNDLLYKGKPLSCAD